MEILQVNDAEGSRRKVADAVDVPTSTGRNVLDRREWYAKREE